MTHVPDVFQILALAFWILGGVLFGTAIKETSGQAYTPLWILMLWPLFVVGGILWGAWQRLRGQL